MRNHGWLWCWAILSLGAAASTAIGSADPTPLPGERWELEGMCPGQTFSEIDRRFELRHQVPLHSSSELRYILEATRPLPGSVTKELTGNGIDRLELIFRADRLRSVRVAYAGRDEVLFAEMGAELEAEFGPPAKVVQRGPMSVGRSRGIRFYFWLSIWTWEFADTTLTVEGKHFGVDKVREHPDVHEYVFTLSERSGT